MHLSPSQFGARCREELGLGAIEWLRSQRLAQARLLRDSGLSVAEVAHQTGYRSPSALTAALLAAVSLLPKAKTYTPIVAVAAVLGVLLVIGQIINRPNGFSIGWALWLVLLFTVFQAAAAVTALLFESGVLSAPAPARPSCCCCPASVAPRFAVPCASAVWSACAACSSVETAFWS